MPLPIPNLLSIITFLPLVGAAVVALTAGDRAKKRTALGFSLLTFVVSLLLWVNWQSGAAGMQFVEDLPWFPAYGMTYLMGVDGISLFLVLLTTLLMPIAIYFSNLYVEEQLGLYLVLMLVLETAMIGVFLALDLVLFFVFFEFSLIPMYLLIGKWGGGNRVYAALKFFLYTFAGSALMLVAILVVYFTTGTFNILELQRGTASARRYRRGPSWPLRWPSPSRCRSSPSTPGCPMPTSRRPPPARSSWRAYCSRWAPTAICASPCRSSPRPQRASVPGSRPWR